MQLNYSNVCSSAYHIYPSRILKSKPSRPQNKTNQFQLIKSNQAPHKLKPSNDLAAAWAHDRALSSNWNFNRRIFRRRWLSYSSPRLQNPKSPRNPLSPATIPIGPLVKVSGGERFELWRSLPIRCRPVYAHTWMHIHQAADMLTRSSRPPLNIVHR